MDVTVTKAMAGALYRPARTAFAYRVPESLGVVEDGDASEDTPAERIARMVRCPNAMRPVGWGMADSEAEAAVLAALGSPAPRPGHWMVHGADGTFEGALTDAEFIAAWTPGYHDPYVHYAFEGPEKTLLLAPSGGLVNEDGVLFHDLRTALAGLVRVDGEGGPIVAADAPLSVQASVLFEAEEEDHARHIVHVLAAVESLRRDADPGTWLDVAALDGVVAEAGEGNPTPAHEVAERLVTSLDCGYPEDPMWRLGLAWDTVPEDWTSRDTPGSGAIWRAVDGKLPEAPNGDAQFVLLDGTEPPAAIMDWFEGAPGGSRTATDGTGTALVDLGHALVAVAWLPEGGGEGRGDPLMAEELVGFVPDVSRDLDGPRDGGEAILEALSDLDLYAVLPDPDLYPGYAHAVLLKAHADGAGIPDLLASLGHLVVQGVADEAFMDGDEGDGELTDDERREAERTARRAGAAGGERHPVLVAMLAGIDSEAWADVDLPRDVTALLDAHRSGGTLADVSAALVDEGAGDDA